MVQVESLRTERKFKKTEIGDIPVDWRVVQVKDVCEKPEYGFTASAVEKPIGPKFLRITDIQDGRVIWNNVPYCNCPDSLKERYIIRSGNILFARTGATTGKSYLIKDCPEAIFASYLIRIVVKEQINSHFLYLVFNSFIYWRQITQQMGGSAQGGVNASSLANIKIPLPSILEQKKIAEILSTVDTAIEKSKEIIEKTKELKKGLMQELLTRGIGHKKFKKTEIGMIPVEWKVVKLKELYKSPIRDFGSFSTTKLVKYTGEGIAFLRSENFKEGKLAHENIMYINEEVHRVLVKSIVKKGVLMFTKIGNIGHADIYDGRYGECNSNATIAKMDIDEKKAFVPYIRWILNSKIAMKQFQGRIISTPPRINLGEISELSIPLPIYSEQEKIAEALNKLENLIDNEEKQGENIEILKNGLMQSLLTGQTRVKT